MVLNMMLPYSPNEHIDSPVVREKKTKRELIKFMYYYLELLEGDFGNVENAVFMMKEYDIDIGPVMKALAKKISNGS